MSDYNDIYFEGKNVGRLYDDGDIYVDGRKIGKLYSDGDIYVDGHKMGKLYDDGDIYVDGHKYGKVYNDGDIYKDNRKIGQIHPIKNSTKKVTEGKTSHIPGGSSIFGTFMGIMLLVALIWGAFAMYFTKWGFWNLYEGYGIWGHVMYIIHMGVIIIVMVRCIIVTVKHDLNFKESFWEAYAKFFLVTIIVMGSYEIVMELIEWKSIRFATLFNIRTLVAAIVCGAIFAIAPSFISGVVGSLIVKLKHK